MKVFDYVLTGQIRLSHGFDDVKNLAWITDEAQGWVHGSYSLNVGPLYADLDAALRPVGTHSSRR